jgi:hypothetical protein
MKSEYVLEGRRTTTLAAFYAEVGQALLGGQPWGENLDALHEWSGEMPRLLKRH